MSVINKIHGAIYNNAAYEPKLQNAKESGVKKDDKLKDSVALSNKVSAKSSDESVAVLRKLVESQADIRLDRVSVLKEQIANGTYTIDDKIDKISDGVIDSITA